MYIRAIEKNEIMLLTDFLYEAIFQEEGRKPVPRTVLQEPSVWIYIDAFGTKKEDYCFVAEIDRKVVGAVWARCVKAFGDLGKTVPELAISIYPEYRRQGIGTALMEKMLAHLKAEGFAQTSLAVQKNNYAIKLYRKLGFVVYDEKKTEYIMLYPLHPHENQSV